MSAETALTVGMVGLTFVFVSLHYVLNPRKEFFKIIFFALAFLSGIMSAFTIGIIARANGYGGVGNLSDVMGGMSSIMYLIWMWKVAIDFLKNESEELGDMASEGR